MHKYLKYITTLLVVIFIMILCCNVYINRFSAGFLYDDLPALPENEYGLVPGTNKYLARGGLNAYFMGRTKAASDLYHAGKIRKIIVSGYVEGIYYDEPDQIKKELLLSGVPDSVILPDTTGYRTMSSIQNLPRLENTDTITIISQRFHNQRAVFLAHQTGTNAIGYNVPDDPTNPSFRIRFREILAKTLAFWETIL